MKLSKPHIIYALIGISLLCISSCKRKETGEQDVVTINQRVRSKIYTLDPADIGDAPSSQVCEEFFECLYGYHYLKRPYQLTTELAEAMPTVSEDGKTVTIPIIQNAYFHDDPCFEETGGVGRLLTAHDFVYAWKRIANVKSRSKNWWIFDGRIMGLDEFREYSKTCKKGEVDYDRPVEGLQAIDDFTIQIKLHKPWPQLAFWLAHLPTAAMAKEAVDYYGPEIGHHPVGTGAYMLKTWNRGVYLDAVVNPKYRPDTYPTEGMEEDVAAGLLADAGKPVPTIGRIIWRVIVEESPRWLLLMRGDIDINTIPKDSFGDAVSMGTELTPEMKERGMKLILFDEPCTFWVAFNMNDPILGKNKPLRRAISCAIDREKFIEIILSTKGKPAHGFIPPAMAGSDKTISQWSPARFDPAAARQWLKEAEIVHGGPIPPLRLAGRVGTTGKQTLQFLARNLSEIGLDVKIELYDWPTFLERMRTNQLQMFFSGWIADYPDVENFLQVFYSKNAPWPNSSCYSNPEFDAIYDQIAEMDDCPERTALYREAEKMVIEDAPCAFTYHRIGYIIHHSWLSNIKPDPYRPDTLGSGYTKYYKVDPKKRDEYRKKKY